MQLEFKHVLPAPLQETEHAQDSIWQNQFTLEFPQKVILNAGSGRGKSTFINILNGTRSDYSGQVFLDQEDIQNFSLAQWIELRRVKLSVVFQDLQLFPELTVWENLMIKNELTQHKTHQEIKSMLSFLGIGDRKEQICKTLSLGQQQRVAILRALLQPFDLLLMDEPFSHLDRANASSALELIVAETDKNKAGFILTSLGSHHSFSFDHELKL